MRFTSFILLSTVFFAAPLGAEFEPQMSNAARWLINEQVEAGCDTRGGRFEGGFFELDLTGDDKRDLVLSHEGLTCNSAPLRSSLCGAQACSVLIYVRHGKLLEKSDEAFGAEVEVGDGVRPVITMFGHGGVMTSLRWQNEAFEEIKQ